MVRDTQREGGRGRERLKERKKLHKFDLIISEYGFA